jgi:chromosome segregation ATPase
VDWVALLGAALGAGGLSGVVTAWLARPKTKADAAAVLTDAALRQVNELQEQVATAHAEAREARAEAEAARRQVRLLTAEVDQCMQTLRAWRAAIFAPDATVAGLRAMVGPEPGSNGR